MNHVLNSVTHVLIDRRSLSTADIPFLEHNAGMRLSLQEYAGLEMLPANLMLQMLTASLMLVYVQRSMSLTYP